MLIKLDPSRSEMSSFYWKSWRNRRWKAHLLWFLIFFIVASSTAATKRDLNFLLLAQVAAIGAIPIGLWIFFPTLFFTRAMRSLEVGKEGLTFSMGSARKTLIWKRIAKVYEEDRCFVVVLAQGSEFIIPTRCFDNRAHANAFRFNVDAYIGSSVAR